MAYQWEQAYKDTRNKLIDGEREHSKSYDKYVLTLSGGALALSMTFIHDIIGDDPVRVPALIVLAWIVFTLSVAATLVSVNQSVPLFRDFCDILDSKAEHAGDSFSWAEVREEQSKCRRLRLMDWLHIGSLVLFLLGVILLVLFVTCNLTGATSMSDQTPQQPKNVSESMSPAAAPVGGNPPLVSPGRTEKHGKPTVAQVDVAPLTPPIVSPDPDHRTGKPPLAPVDVSPKPEPKTVETEQPPPADGD